MATSIAMCGYDYDPEVDSPICMPLDHEVAFETLKIGRCPEESGPVLIPVVKHDVLRSLVDHALEFRYFGSVQRPDDLEYHVELLSAANYMDCEILIECFARDWRQQHQ